MKHYFSHDYSARTDKKLVLVSMRYGLSGIGAYWCIVEMLYEEGGRLPAIHSEYERISFELRCEYDLIDSIINDFDLFKIEDNYFYSETAIKRLSMRADKSEKARNSVSYRWKKQDDTNVLRPLNDGNTIKEKKIKEKKKNIPVNCDAISGYTFDEFWNDYDKKVGDKSKLEIKFNRISESERDMMRAHIHEYTISQPDKKFRKNPETYLNNKSWKDEIIRTCVNYNDKSTLKFEGNHERF